MTIKSKTQGRFDARKLEDMVEVVQKRELREDALLKSTGNKTCKLCGNRQTGVDTAILAMADSYVSRAR